MYNPSQTDVKYALYDRPENIFDATPPRITPKTDAITTTTGIIKIPDNTLGVNKYPTESTPKTSMASICSVTLIVAISDARDEPIIEINAKPDIITPTSLTVKIVISIPIKPEPPCFTISFAT